MPPRKSRRAVVKSEGVADPLATTQDEDQAALDAGEVSGARLVVGDTKMCSLCC